MADTLQKVFLIFTRPYYIDTVGGVDYPVMYNGAVKTADNKALTTNNATAVPTSPQKLNYEGTYKQDPWFMHSSYTSYEEMRMALKSLLGTYSTDNIRCAIYVPIDVEVEPTK